jgi:hypothetical protein
MPDFAPEMLREQPGGDHDPRGHGRQLDQAELEGVARRPRGGAEVDDSGDRHAERVADLLHGRHRARGAAGASRVDVLSTVEVSG